MFKKILFIALGILLILSTVSCTGDEGVTGSRTSVEDIALPDYKSGDVISLNVYNWGEYISDGSEDSLNVNKEFEAYFNEHLSEKYGGIKIKVEYSTYPTNEDMYAKISSGAATGVLFILWWGQLVSHTG